MLSAYSSDTDSQLSIEDAVARVAAKFGAAAADDEALTAAVTEALGEGSGLAEALRAHGAVPLQVSVGPGAKPSAAADAALDAHIAGLVAGRGLEDSFYVVDLGVVARLHTAWTLAMPRVQPFYAVKCNGELLTATMMHSCLVSNASGH